MAIRFLCAGCSQPIEVDDEFAMRLVACPYCRRTITAPRETILPEASGVAEARPGAVIAPPTTVSAEPLLTAAAPARNGPAVAAAVLLAVALASLIGYFLVFAGHSQELTRMMPTTFPPDMSAIMKAQQRLFEEYGGVPPWMIALGAFEILAGMTWIGAVACAIVGLTGRRARKGLALTVLILSCVLPIVACCAGGWLVQMIARPAGAATVSSLAPGPSERPAAEAAAQPYADQGR